MLLVSGSRVSSERQFLGRCPYIFTQDLTRRGLSPNPRFQAIRERNGVGKSSTKKWPRIFVGSWDVSPHLVGKKNPGPIYKRIYTRWAPTSYEWSYNPYNWDYKWVSGVITLLIGVINLLITGRGPTL